MKKFKYKLDAVLKLREFHETKIKLKLASILKEIKNLEDKNFANEAEIAQAYQQQEEVLETSADAQTLQFFPMFIQGKRAEIERNKKMIESRYVTYQATIVEMKKAMGEVKIMENLKDKAKDEHKKEFNKKLQQDSDDNVIMKIIRERINSGEL